MCGRVCVIEKKLQERFRKVSFADSEKPEIIVKPGQGAPIHRKQNLRGLPKAHERAAPSQCLKSMTIWDGRRQRVESAGAHGEGLETVNGNVL